MKRRKQYYNKQVKQDLRIRYNKKHSSEVGSLKRVIVGQGLRNRQFDSKYLVDIYGVLLRRTGQHPQIIRTTKSVSSYRLMVGDVVGAKTTRTGNAMYAFLDNLVSNVRPNTRPFSGIPMTSLDDKGNFTFFVKQPIAFSELGTYYEVLLPLCSKPGLYITIETNCKTKEEAISLLTSLKVPLV